MDPCKIQEIGKVLADTTRPLKERFRALFTLKNVGGELAIDCISSCFSDSSALLKHELAYCLGQMLNPYAIPELVKVLEDKNQDPMVRHEAGEALGAIGSVDAVSILEKYKDDPTVEVAETCQLALERINWLQSKEKETEKLSKNPYFSTDPAPPSTGTDISRLQAELLDESLPLFKRYRAMFSLRNIGTKEAVVALAKGLKCSSALFRHEIAYVLGQMQHDACIQELKENLCNEAESPMVRHECAEALGAIATDECTKILEQYLTDKERVVKESCVVALDMCDYEHSKEFQYADALTKLSHQNGQDEQSVCS